MSSRLAFLLSTFAATYAQQVGTNQAEVHPPLTWQTCTAPGSCKTVNGKIVLDSNWRWLHNVGGSTNCYTGNTWNSALCPNNVNCASNCALDGGSYASTYGITTSGNALRLNFVTQASQKNIGSRVYLMADDDKYQTFNMLNQEFTFDVDTSKLPCGLNGALYMVGMDADGGVAAHPTNKAGAKYGTGYCDAQCPRDLKFIGGQANVEGWIPSSNNVNTGVGNRGSCCAEMDIWEANSISTAFTPHSADDVGPTLCTGDSCGGSYSADRYAGTTDPDGCDFNSFRQGDKTFYGPGLKVNTNSPFTVVTQFLTSSGTSSGSLSEIKRFYVQNGKVIPNSQSTIAGVPGNSITTAFCNAQKKAFGDSNGFADHGGMASMSASLKDGMVLAMSLWDDYYANLLWLDSNYPVAADPSKPGIARGTCPTTSGVPADVEAAYPNAYVIYSNIKFGAINSTFSGTLDNGGSGTTTSRTGTSTTSSATTTSTGALAAKWAQCGGLTWGGATQCVAGSTCTKANDFYWQCL